MKSTKVIRPSESATGTKIYSTTSTLRERNEIQVRSSRMGSGQQDGRIKVGPHSHFGIVLIDKRDPGWYRVEMCTTMGTTDRTSVDRFDSSQLPRG